MGIRLTLATDATGPPGRMRALARGAYVFWLQLVKLSRTRTVRSYYGVRMRANWADATFNFCACGTYGTFFSDYLSRTGAPFVFVDIGANQGLYSLIAASNPFCSHTYAFEPVPGTADLLAENIRLNGAAQRCTLVRKAISDADAIVPIHVRPGHSGVASVSRVVGSGHCIEIETMAVQGFDAVLPSGTHPIILKIDVEGHEETVIEQVLRSAHASRFSAIFYECDERWVDAPRICQMLDAAGFTRRQVSGQGVHYDVLASRA